MKASELRMGQLQQIRRALDRARNALEKGIEVRMMDQWPALVPIVPDAIREVKAALEIVHGWDEPQSEHKLPGGFTRYDGSGKPNLPDDTEVEFCLRNDNGKPTDVTTVGGLGWSWDDEDYSPGGDVIGYRVVESVKPAPLQLREGEPQGDWVVEIDKGVWLAPWKGDPGRTLVLNSATRFPTSSEASIAVQPAPITPVNECSLKYWWVQWVTPPTLDDLMETDKRGEP